jgi:phosphoglycerate dehydrogenase-like enzyme
MTHRLLAVGDSYLPAADMARVLADLGPGFEVGYRTVDPDDRPPLPNIHEYQGSPSAISGWLGDEDVLLVHAAPVTGDLLDAHPSVRIVACARGGAVNVDLEAARERGVVVINTPAKNAESVTELVGLSIHSLFRGVGAAQAWLRARSAAGGTHLDSTFIGGQFIAREPRGHTLGLVGYGAIGRLVATRAIADGMRVIAFDPYASTTDDGVELVDLPTLLADSDLVSLHAKATPETRHLANAAFFAGMKPGALFVNSARESLVDEDALLAALLDGRLAGAALDVCEPDGRWPELALLPQVLITPHLGGATVQTQDRSMRMLVEDLQRWAQGIEPIRRVA